MNELLPNKITEEELKLTVRVMAKGKTPGYDGILLEFFQQTWPYMCLDYHAMIFQMIEEGTLHEDIAKGLSPQQLQNTIISLYDL
jgi:hypothetical protein